MLSFVCNSNLWHPPLHRHCHCHSRSQCCKTKFSYYRCHTASVCPAAHQCIVRQSFCCAVPKENRNRDAETRMENRADNNRQHSTAPKSRAMYARYEWVHYNRGITKYTTNIKQKLLPIFFILCFIPARSPHHLLLEKHIVNRVRYCLILFTMYDEYVCVAYRIVSYRIPTKWYLILLKLFRKFSFSQADNVQIYTSRIRNVKSLN